MVRIEDVEDVLCACMGEAESGQWRGIDFGSMLHSTRVLKPGVKQRKLYKLLTEQVAEFGSLGPIITCGDFSARCGNLDLDS